MSSGRVPERYLLILGTFLLSMLCYVDRVCISVARDDVTADLGFDAGHESLPEKAKEEMRKQKWGWVLAAFAFGYALFQTPSGMLADRFGPRAVLTFVVASWSIFTALTGLVQGLVLLLVVRFLFGMGEAGAFPGTARAIFSWLPMNERGIAQGINFSGGRLGAAFALPLVAWMVSSFRWRKTFWILGGIGLVWAIVWYGWFRDDPAEHRGVSIREREYILAGRQGPRGDEAPGSRLAGGALLGSGNMWLLMTQYFASNFTFFFCLGWLFPYLKDQYGLEFRATGWYAMTPLVFGALGNWAAGAWVDLLYRRGHWKLSRILPASTGFLLAAVGLVFSSRMESALGAVAWLSVAIFGADMTLSPSWAACIDIGRRHSGAVSGTMNMAGNFGSAVTALAFPYLLDWTGKPEPFFYVGAGLNILAIVAWQFVRPDRSLKTEHAPG